MTLLFYVQVRKIITIYGQLITCHFTSTKKSQKSNVNQSIYQKVHNMCVQHEVCDSLLVQLLNFHKLNQSSSHAISLENVTEVIKTCNSVFTVLSNNSTHLDSRVVKRIT
jgi:hypothetical protein